MSVKKTARMQYLRLVNQTAEQLKGMQQPHDGWLATMRKALGMSGSEVAARAGVSRNAIYQSEHNEQGGAITLNQMEKIAAAMGGRLIYAIVPDGKVEDIIYAHALKKAEKLIYRASAHMALEKQSLPPAQTKQRIEELAGELMRDMPPDFWKVK